MWTVYATFKTFVEKIRCMGLKWAFFDMQFFWSKNHFETQVEPYFPRNKWWQRNFFVPFLAFLFLVYLFYAIWYIIYVSFSFNTVK